MKFLFLFFVCAYAFFEAATEAFTWSHSPRTAHMVSKYHAFRTCESLSIFGAFVFLYWADLVFLEYCIFVFFLILAKDQRPG